MSLPAAGTVDHAIHLINAGDLPAAESTLNALLQSDPNSPLPLHLLGLVRHKQGRPAEATELMRRSIELLPDHADFHNNLGEALRGAGRHAEAEQAYRRAIALNPNQADATANLGLVRLAQRDLSAAEQLFRDAIRIRPTHAVAHQHLRSRVEDRHSPSHQPRARRDELVRQQRRAPEGGLGAEQRRLAARPRAQIEPALPRPHRAHSAEGECRQLRALVLHAGASG